VLPLVIVAGVAVLGALFLMLERKGESEPMAMEDVTHADGDGFSVVPPAGYRLIVDPRVTVPGGGVALGREDGGTRATIVVVPYPADSDQLITETGCQTVAKLHAKQVGAQLIASKLVVRDSGASCTASLSEGPSAAGTMILQAGGKGALMLTCRHPSDSTSDAEACAQVAKALRTAKAP